jgi:hypothetical protein
MNNGEQGGMACVIGLLIINEINLAWWRNIRPGL